MTASVHNVLVTGSLGFTGYYVTRALEKEGYKVIHFTDNALVSGKVLDLCDYSIVEEFILKNRPESLIHLAAVAFVGHGDPWDFYKVNVGGSLNLLRALDVADCVKGNLVFASSANIYGDAYQGIAIEESFESKPVNDYAVSKLSLEKMLSLWQNRFNIVITRPFNYTGVGQSASFLIPKIVNAFRECVPILELGNLNVCRDYSDVRDIAEIYKLIINKNLSDKTINICSGKVYSIREIVEYCEKITGYNLKIKSVSALQRNNEIKSLLGNPSQLKHLLNYNMHYDLRNTLSWMLSQ